MVKLLNQKEKIKTLIESIIRKVSKNKEPIRLNRLYSRWNVYIKKLTTLKFRVDGRRNPHVRKTKSGYIRIAG